MLKTKPVSQTLKIAGIAASVSLASLVISPKANAASLFFSDSSSFSNQVTELDGEPQLIVSKYKPTAGQKITQVLISLTTNLSSTGTIKNNAAQAQTFTVGTAVDTYDFVAVDGSPAVLSTLTPFPDSPLIGKQKYTKLASGESSSFGTYSINGSTSVSFTNASDIAQFLGSGTFGVSPYTSIFTSIAGGGGNVSTNITTLTGATFKVDYYGEEVPEPFTILGTLTAAGFGVAMKKFKSQQNIA
ncbi:PEP-CTERM sorting domain-containing protein [Cylindrospermum sp. FACHB-282]|uniref:PEP-CTERM sorting domain-containing protein n=1 Tax=Cylindrospermum sp. FACHB-282 TaxID=2692794 RepID=UPI0016865EE9|nr:PEP-CTERM sorting domain-containing protein [Cylindrospermum sp. FACHB-282]MBD2384599.1 PEP-CTERM sorting domain-containing protein [Cylindrospermum sp. FACHB-282]